MLSLIPAPFLIWLWDLKDDHVEDDGKVVLLVPYPTSGPLSQPMLAVGSAQEVDKVVLKGTL